MKEATAGCRLCATDFCRGCRCRVRRVLGVIVAFSVWPFSLWPLSCWPNVGFPYCDLSHGGHSRRAFITVASFIVVPLFMALLNLDQS